MKKYLILSVFLVFPFSVYAEKYVRKQIVFGNVFAKIEVETKYGKRRAFKEIQKGFDLINRFNDIFSTYKADTEIYRLNATQKPIFNYPVSPHMLAVLRLAQEITEKTDGYFDITYKMSRPASDKIKINAQSVDLLQNNLKIDPTGLVKGYAVDQVIKLLKKNPKILAATVSLGGDIGHFDRLGRGKSVALFDPKQPYPLPLTNKKISLKNESVSTSGFYERGRHIKNTKKNKSEHMQVSVVANKCSISDALATAMIFMPIREIKRTLKKFPGARVYVVERNGKRITVQGP